MGKHANQGVYPLLTRKKSIRPVGVPRLNERKRYTWRSLEHTARVDIQRFQHSTVDAIYVHLYVVNELRVYANTSSCLYS